jgi:hypothetical protein
MHKQYVLLMVGKSLRIHNFSTSELRKPHVKLIYVNTSELESRTYVTPIDIVTTSHRLITVVVIVPSSRKRPPGDPIGFSEQEVQTLAIP